jgi:hypothetical protein
MDCTCSMPGLCERRGIVLGRKMHMYCQAGRGDIVDATFDKRPHKQVPPISDVGTRIQNAIEQAAEFRFTCGHCVSYLRSLNQQAEHDAEEITLKLIHELQLPIEVRQKIGNTAAVRFWLREIVSKALGPS